jgi:hypothetical protein
MRKIVTTHVYPPIPIRQFDWQAHYDGEEDEQMDAGYGRTKEEAVVDLIENYPRGQQCTRAPFNEWPPSQMNAEWIGARTAS